MRSLIILIILLPSAFLYAQDNWGWPDVLEPESWQNFCADFAYGYHSVAISSNDSLIFITYLCLDSSTYYSGIVSSRFLNGQWQPLEDVPIQSDDEWPFPIFYYDQEDTLLYFASSIPGSHGGSDIWASQFVNNTWTQPFNLGPVINSAGNESCPSLPDNDSRLYFSRGETIMYSDKINGQYADPVALPSIVNTDLTEFEPRISRDGQKLYFNRYGIPYRPDTMMVSHFSNGQWQEPIPLNGYINCNHSPYCPTIPCTSRGPSFTGNGAKMYHAHFHMWGYWCDPIYEIRVSELATDVKEPPPTIPSALSISAYPNPFNGRTNITIDGDFESLSEIAIYDITGRRIKSFEPASQIAWDGTDNGGGPVSSGIYFVKAKACGFENSLRITFLK